MCGIVGYVGQKEAYPILFDGLKRLEYRGYDSAGITVFGGALKVVKTKGRLDNLPPDEPGLAGTTGIGHTRWATHGRPSEANAHPHFDCHKKLAIVHNGIIENYYSLKQALIGAGHQFVSETDSEVVAHLIEETYRGDLKATLREVITRLEGSFALVILHSDYPGELYAVRQDSSLIVGKGHGEQFVASDIPALLPYSRDIHVLEDGEIAQITREKVVFTDLSGKPIEKETQHVPWDLEAAEKGGYSHFMLKEIFEQSQAIRNTLQGRLDPALGVSLPILQSLATTVQRIHIVAMGTARHAGLVGKGIIEKLARIPVEVELGSEFRYKDPLVDEKSLTIIVSQSGETADTLAGLREAKRRGSPILAITNVVGSSIAREADFVLYTYAGPEIAVASTKAYTTQLVVLTLIGLYLAKQRGHNVPVALYEELMELPILVERTLEELKGIVPAIANKLKDKEHLYFIGRGLDHPVVEEGALKLKEISYIHAQAYAAGELKHGTLALIDQDSSIIALACQELVIGKMVSNIQEVQARDAKVIAVTFQGESRIANIVEDVLYLPVVDSLLSPVLSVLPLQLIAYYVANARGCDIDKPRNLAKSVTVE